MDAPSFRYLLQSFPHSQPSEFFKTEGCKFVRGDEVRDGEAVDAEDLCLFGFEEDGGEAAVG